MTATFSDLFPTPGREVAADYLAFVAERVPKDIAAQLQSDCAPELGSDEIVFINDLVDPLSNYSFPTGAEGRLWKISSILEYTVFCYSNSRYRNNKSIDDPYKLIYVTSLYLHCFVKGPGPEAGAYLPALLILADVSSRLDLETRLQVCRFLGLMIPAISAGATSVSALLNELAPVSIAIGALSIIVGSVASDLTCIAATTLDDENIVQEWSPDNKYCTTSGHEWIASLRQMVSDVYGKSGKLQRGAERFISAIEMK